MSGFWSEGLRRVLRTSTEKLKFGNLKNKVYFKLEQKA
jgi:hypothetical protein